RREFLLPVGFGFLDLVAHISNYPKIRAPKPKRVPSSVQQRFIPRCAASFSQVSQALSNPRCNLQEGGAALDVVGQLAAHFSKFARILESQGCKAYPPKNNAAGAIAFQQKNHTKPGRTRQNRTLPAFHFSPPLSSHNASTILQIL